MTSSIAPLAAAAAVLLAATSAAADPAVVDQPPPERSRALRLAEFASVTASGIQAGWLIGGAVVSGPTRRSLDFAGYVEYQQDFLERSNPVGPLLMPVTTVANLVPLWLMRKQRKGGRFWFTVAGLACNVGVIAAAAAFNVPAIDEIESWSASQAAPADWRDVRDRWETGQTLRMIFAVGAFGSNAAAAMVF